MKKLIYEIYESKRKGGRPIAKVFSDGSVESIRDSDKFKADSVKDEYFRRKLLYSREEMRRLDEFLWMKEIDCFSDNLSIGDYFDNPRYERSYLALRVVTGEEFPFEGYRIVYHGEGKPWIRVMSQWAKP